MRRPPAIVAVAAGLVLAGCPALLPQDATTGETAHSSTSGPASTGPEPTTSTGFMLACYPGEVRCSPGALETCAPTGLEWEATPCAAGEECVADVEAGTAACLGPCDLITSPTSLGCEFLAIRMQSHNTEPGDHDALIVGNTDPTRSARLQFFFTPRNSLTEAPLGDPVELAPGQSHIFPLPDDPFDYYTEFRTGGVYRLASDLPVVAYLHSTLVNKAGSNDASMLLPTRWLGKDHVVASYPGYTNVKFPSDDAGRPSYFVVIALENDTHVRWVASADTAAQGVVIPPRAAGEPAEITLGRFDVLQIGSSAITNTDYATQDLSGTVIAADRPIWVMGATECACVPWDVSYCNHLQEQLIPLEYWGRRYVGPHSPVRNGESHYWRVYAGEDDVTVTVESSDPDHSVDPIVLARRGDWRELEVPNGTSLIFTGTGPILPVQYLASFNATGQTNGDPSMYQMIATEQWLTRAVFVTGQAYALNYAQVIRRKGGADVTIGDQVVSDWYAVDGAGADNQWEVADVELPGGDEARTYVATSTDPFNVIVVGYAYKSANTASSAYAYPAGMGLTKIYDP